MIKGLAAGIMTLAVIFGGSTPSHAVTAQQVFNKLMEGAKDVCGKGSFFSGKITIRSGNGVACKNKVVAAVATMKCGKRDDFAESHCGKNAERALNGEDPKKVLIAEAKKGGGMALTAIKKLHLKIKGGSSSEDDNGDGGDDGDDGED